MIGNPLAYQERLWAKNVCDCTTKRSNSGWHVHGSNLAELQPAGAQLVEITTNWEHEAVVWVAYANANVNASAALFCGASSFPPPER